MQLPREVIQQLRDVVFGFDTFYVTSVENYQANGVLFKGNLRGRSPAEAYARTAKRFQVTTTCATIHSTQNAYHELFMSGQVHCWILHQSLCTVQQINVLTPEVPAFCVLLWCITCCGICLLAPSKAAYPKHNAVMTQTWRAQFVRKLTYTVHHSHPRDQFVPFPPSQSKVTSLPAMLIVACYTQDRL